MRKCTKCGIEKPRSEYHNHRLMKDGLSLWCKTCANANSKKYRSTATGIYTNICGRTRFAKKNPNKGRGIPKIISISREEFVAWYDSQPKECHYCGVPKIHLKEFMQEYGSRWHRFTIDCVDNEIGYAVGNLVLACDKCNALKSNILSYDEMREFAQKYINPKWAKFECRRSTSTTIKVIEE